MKQPGYTIIEMLIYLAVFALLSILLINTVLLTGRAFRDARATRARNAAASEALERMVREIRFADDVDEGGSILSTHPGVLKLASIDPSSETAQIITFALTNNQLTLQKNTGAPVNLTPNTLAVSNLVFRHIVSSSSQAIKIEMTIEGINLFGSAVLRRSY